MPTLSQEVCFLHEDSQRIFNGRPSNRLFHRAAPEVLNKFRVS